MNVPDKQIGNSGVMARILLEHRCRRGLRSICRHRSRVFIVKIPGSAVIRRFGRRQMWPDLNLRRSKTILKPVAVMLKRALRISPLTAVSSKFTKMMRNLIAKLLSKGHLLSENMDKALWRAITGWKLVQIRPKWLLLS